MPITDASVERTFRQEFGRAVATLVRLFGDIDLAEEAVQEAFVVALQRWPTAGVPPNPGGWIVTTARNRAIDRLRREASRNDRHAQSVLVLAAVDALDLGGYHPFHATRADLLRRLGRPREAADAYDAALALVGNATERRFLEQRRGSLPVA